MAKPDKTEVSSLPIDDLIAVLEDAKEQIQQAKMHLEMKDWHIAELAKVIEEQNAELHRLRTVKDCLAKDLEAQKPCAICRAYYAIAAWFDGLFSAF